MTFYKVKGCNKLCIPECGDFATSGGDEADQGETSKVVTIVDRILEFTKMKYKSMYDLYDANNEGYDSQSAGFSAVSQIASGSAQVKTLNTFWNNWITGHNQLLSGLKFWWNTIN